MILNWVRIRSYLVFSSTGPGSKELYRKNAEPEQLPSPSNKNSFSLSPGAELVQKEGIQSKRRDPGENKKRKHSGSGSGLKTIFFITDSEKYSILHIKITLT